MDGPVIFEILSVSYTSRGQTRLSLSPISGVSVNLLPETRGNLFARMGLAKKSMSMPFNAGSDTPCPTSSTIIEAKDDRMNDLVGD